MKTIGQRSLMTALSLMLAFGVSGAASAQQQAPVTQAQQNAPPQQAAPAQPGPGMGQKMMKDGMEHEQMGRKGMEGEHGRMGSGMQQGQSKDSAPTTGANPSTAPSTGSK
ncbi:hypothetical protein IP86_17320 [Rhodopseudomonas sp. AAP120]|nr:putative exported protein of unknown function [Rhodopseudomonas palustris TIE-1]KPF96235.1 hypothetical protein IP86_17320 [Rhodopseudomonas sp. AAP120]